MRFFFSGPRILGIRPGIIFGASDFNRIFRSSSRKQVQANQSTANFIYVIEGEAGKHKIGVSADPINRISQLQTGSPVALKFAYIGLASESAYEIEAQTHAFLRNYNTKGEWFCVPASIAIGAVLEVGNRLGKPVQQVQPEMISTVLALSKKQITKKPSKLGRYLLIANIILWTLCYLAS